MRRDGHEWAMTIGAIALAALAAGLAARGGRAQAGQERARASAVGRDADRPAYAPGVAAGVGDTGTRGDVRPAGPESVRDPYRRWDQVDELVDETFPASDPPATY